MVDIPNQLHTLYKKNYKWNLLCLVNWWSPMVFMTHSEELFAVCWNSERCDFRRTRVSERCIERNGSNKFKGWLLEAKGATVQNAWSFSSPSPFSKAILHENSRNKSDFKDFPIWKRLSKTFLCNINSMMPLVRQLEFCLQNSL